MKSRRLIAIIALVILSPLAVAHSTSGLISREKLMNIVLAALPGHQLTAVTVTLKPGASAPAHYHEATVFAYVLSGTVQSQLNDQLIQTWQAGDSWIERPGDQHTLTRNPSQQDNATILAVFVAEQNARLTTSGALSSPAK